VTETHKPFSAERKRADRGARSDRAKSCPRAGIVAIKYVSKIVTPVKFIIPRGIMMRRDIGLQAKFRARQRSSEKL